MRRRNRIFFTALVAVLSITAVIGLVVLGRETEGPLGSVLVRLGTRLSNVESDAVRRVRGRTKARASALEWAAVYRQNADALRKPDTLLLGAYHESLPHSVDGVLALETALGRELA